MAYLNSPQDTAQMDMMVGMEMLHELSNWQHAKVPFGNGPEQYVAAAMGSSSPAAWELSFGESSGGRQRLASVEAMREVLFRIAAMQPIHIDPESVKPPKRRNVRISKDPQSVAARHRRERISERIRILQRLVPGGTKMDTASMLEEAIHYVKFLKNQVQSLEQAAAWNQQHFAAGTSDAMTATASSAEAGFSPDVNYKLSVGNYYEATPDRGFDMNTTTTTTHMFY